LTRPFRFFWWGLGQLYYDLLPLTLKVNLPWLITAVVLLAPLLFVAGYLLTIAQANAMTLTEVLDQIITGRTVPPQLLLGVPILILIVMLIAGPGTAALYHSVYRFMELEPVTLGLFLRGFKKYFVRGWLLGSIDLLILFILLITFMFYWFSGEIFLQVLAVIVLYMLIFWALIQPYLYALMIRLDTGVYHTLRNAAVLVLGNPGMTFGLGVVSLISLLGIGLLSLLALLLGPSVVVLTCHRAVQELLSKYDVPEDLDGGSKP